MAQQATLGQLRVDHNARDGDARAARTELAAAQADREQLTRRLAKAAGHAEAEALKLDKVAGELAEVGVALAAQRRQTEMREERLAGVAAEHDQ